MNHIVAVLCLAVAATVQGDNKDYKLPPHAAALLSKPGDQYNLYKTTKDKITLNKEGDLDDTYIGLDIHKDKKVDIKDLELFFWYHELAYAIPKVFTFIEEQKDGIIEKSELIDDFDNKNVEVALKECHYLKAEGLRQSCFADQLLTYISLVLEEDDYNSFYNDLAKTNTDDGKITKDEVEALHTLHKDKSDKVIGEPATMAEELGAADGETTKEELIDYITQETLNDDFRRCRTSVDAKKGDIDFDNKCLKEELVEYIHDDLTDLDIAVLFRAVDVDNSGKITEEEIKKLPEVKDLQGEEQKKMVEKIMILLDMSITIKENGKAVVDFGEFRSYMRSPTVLIQSERECTEKENKQAAELDCLFDLFVDLVTDSHDAIWLVVPDLEQQIAFEIVDDKEDGIIHKSELSKFISDAQTKKKFIEEFDTDDKEETVDLEEWNEYMDVPHMVYGTGDCLLHKQRVKKDDDAPCRETCYPAEIKDIIENFKDVPDTWWKEWFDHYDSENDGVINRKDKNEGADRFGSQGLEDLFLVEVGQGDNTITPFEFTWYGKQQELADKYKAENFADGKPVFTEFHKDLKNYIENDMTEYDTEQFFAKLDEDKSHKLDQNDFKQNGLWDKVKDLIKKIDDIGEDADTNVNFREFWLWIHSDHNGKKVEKIFEEHCTEKLNGAKQQEAEIICYVDKFHNHAADLFL